MTSLQHGFRIIKREPVFSDSIPVPTPSNNQVVVKVLAAGLCHSDLHLMEDLPTPYDNYVLGHEIAGEVHQVGEGVTQFTVGDRVAVYGPNGCSHCFYCEQGKENICVGNDGLFGMGRDGGFQQYTLVENIDNLIKLPPNVSYEVAAVTTDAVLTPYHALRQAKASKDTHVLFIGCGGLGLNSVQIAKALGSKVTVIDRKEEALELAKKFGADEAYTALPDSIPPFTYDAVVDFVNNQATFDTAIGKIKRGGSIIPVGLGSSSITYNTAVLLANESKVCGSFWGTRQDLRECLELVNEGKVTPKITKFPLKELISCFKTLKEGKIEGRIVMVPEH